MERIPLKKKDGSVRAYVLVDDADFEWLNQWAWSMSSNGYAKRAVYVGPPSTTTRYPRYATLRMHRLITGCSDDPSVEVDHEDGNTLNNQRANLRVLLPGEHDVLDAIRRLGPMSPDLKAIIRPLVD